MSQTLTPKDIKSFKIRFKDFSTTHGPSISVKEQLNNYIFVRNPIKKSAPK